MYGRKTARKRGYGKTQKNLERRYSDYLRGKIRKKWRVLCNTSTPIGRREGAK
jgi:hypothetical protein